MTEEVQLRESVALFFKTLFSGDNLDQDLASTTTRLQMALVSLLIIFSILKLIISIDEAIPYKLYKGFIGITVVILLSSLNIYYSSDYRICV